MVDPDLKQLWAETSLAVIGFTRGEPVSHSWTEPSSLPEMTVGAVAGHLIHSGILMVGEALELTPLSHEPLSAGQLLSGVPLEPTDATHGAVRAVAEAQVRGRSDGSS